MSRKLDLHHSLFPPAFVPRAADAACRCHIRNLTSRSLFPSLLSFSPAFAAVSRVFAYFIIRIVVVGRAGKRREVLGVCRERIRAESAMVERATTLSVVLLIIFRPLSLSLLPLPFPVGYLNSVCSSSF